LNDNKKLKKFFRCNDCSTKKQIKPSKPKINKANELENSEIWDESEIIQVSDTEEEVDDNE
ncbi:25145_t:CDS:1, partial [Cetraspora pellucida]